MIGSVMRVQWTNLRRDRVAQLMRFVLPVAFFTVFAFVFGGRGRSGMGRIPVVVVDQSHTAVSARLLRSLDAEQGLVVRTRARLHANGRDTTTVAIDRARAEDMVRHGDVSVALVLPVGLDRTMALAGADAPAFVLLSDPSDPIAPQVVGGLLQKVVITALPDVFARFGVRAVDHFVGLTPGQRTAAERMLSDLTAAADSGMAGGLFGSTDTAGGGAGALARVQVVPVLGQKKDTSMISFYAAGIAVMFLLFSCSAGAGTLLDDVDSGTLERLLSSRLGMTRLLVGKWLYLTVAGVAQILIMFLYAQVAFGLDVVSHLPGFVVMTAVTAAVCASFGLFLATLCRTREQLSGISTLVILLLSALGGSMFPRFLMSDWMQHAGLLTFNAWALDGFVKVFWREAALPELAPQLGVLVAFGVTFCVIARLLARRWERA